MASPGVYPRVAGSPTGIRSRQCDRQKIRSTLYSQSLLWNFTLAKDYCGCEAGGDMAAPLMVSPSVPPAVPVQPAPERDAGENPGGDELFFLKKTT